MAKVKNILVVGVGGQGVLTFAYVLSKVLLSKGYDIKVSEIHGMAQRGGSVHSMIRYGERVFSPLIPKGSADILVALELLEAVRWLDYLSPDGIGIVSEYRVSPMPVILGAEEYPKDCNEAIKKKNKKAIIFNAINFAKEAGNIRTANVVILGVVAKQIKDIKKDEWLEIIKKEVPPKTIESNLKAFNNGWEFQEGD